MVETYVESELSELITDSEKNEAWKAKVQELGLNGQISLVEGKKSPIPFPVMNRAMINTYETLCPIKDNLKEYCKTTIPARVLEMVGLCVKENYFEELHVWYDEVAPDPLLVGTHNKEQYLIARWGDELRAYSELRAIARERKIKTVRNDLQKRSNSLEERVDSWLDGGWEYF